MEEEGFLRTQTTVRPAQSVVYVDRTLPYRKRVYAPEGLNMGFSYLERTNLSEKSRTFALANSPPTVVESNPTGSQWHRLGPLVIPAGSSNDQRVSNRVHMVHLEARFNVKTNINSVRRQWPFRMRAMIVLDKTCTLDQNPPPPGTPDADVLFHSIGTPQVENWKHSFDDFIHQDWHDRIEVLFDHVYQSSPYSSLTPTLYGAVSIPLDFTTHFSSSGGQAVRRNALYCFFCLDPEELVYNAVVYEWYKSNWFYDIRMRLWYSESTIPKYIHVVEDDRSRSIISEGEVVPKPYFPIVDRAAEWRKERAQRAFNAHPMNRPPASPRVQYVEPKS